MYARVSGVGSYLPKRVMSNQELAAMVETSHEWIVERSGIEKRHIAAKEESVVSMAVEASSRALKAAAMTPQELDLIIVATCTNDTLFPSAACLIQDALGAHQAAAFDIGAACAGFVYALATASHFITSSAAKRVLVVGSEVMSRALNWQDRSTCILFGDGAGAFVLTQASSPGLLATQLYADGSQAAILTLPSGINQEPVQIHMLGREVFRLAVERLSSAVEDLVQKAHIRLEEIDWIVPHQANARIIQMIAAKLKISLEKIIVTVDQHANTSSASIPLAFDQGLKEGHFKRGDIILLEAFGGGLTWGGVLLKY